MSAKPELKKQPPPHLMELFARLAAKEAAFQKATIRDVTPKGYGPNE